MHATVLNNFKEVDPLTPAELFNNKHSNVYVGE